MVLEARNVSRIVAGTPLLTNVSLVVEAGNTLALLGPSGSGKTVLLRCLALLDRVQAGNVFWHGAAVSARQVPHFRSRVVYLHQRPYAWDGTVSESLQMPFRLAVHRERRFDRAQVVRWLRVLGRDESFLAKPHRQLSGGEAQLMAVIRAIQLDPEVLLMDEPTSALDVEASLQVEDLVLAWCHGSSGARSLVWVTHNIQQATRVAERVQRIRGGSLEDAT